MVGGVIFIGAAYGYVASDSKTKREAKAVPEIRQQNVNQNK